jgi:tetratricopeptide (TPR) repeat protein
MAIGLVGIAATGCGDDRTRPSADDAERRAHAVDAELADARAALHRDQPDAALAAVERARAVDPNSYRPLMVRGRVLMLADRFAESRAAYQSAARLASNAAQTAAEAADPPDADPGPDAVADRRRARLRDAADAHLAAGKAHLMAAFAQAEERGPAAQLDDATLQDANDAFIQAVDLSNRLTDEHDGDRGLTARLHLALLSALRGNREAALTKIDMLEVGHAYDPDLAAFWRSVIQDGTLRARLTRDDDAP